MPSNNKKTFVIAFAVATAGAAHAACELKVDSLLTTKSVNGANVAYVPKIAEDYRVTANFTITGAPNAPFKVRFEMAGQKKDVMVTNLSQGARNVTANFGRLPLDGTIPLKVTLDFDHTTGDNTLLNNIKTASFAPVGPTTKVEYFEKQTLQMTQTANVAFFNAGSLNRMLLMMGQPSTDSWQTLVSSSCTLLDAWGTHPVSASVANPGFQRVFGWDKNNPGLGGAYMVAKSKVDVKNVKINKGLINASWTQVDALDGINVFKHYKQPEDVVQSNSPEIGAFVTGALGANYRNTMTPYTAARKLFQAVVKHVTYVAPSPSHSAVAVYQNGTGDCGAFSIFFVAACRRVGIPARVACGAWVGTDAGHCWAECYIPGAGWILSDGSASDYWSPNGDYAYCFGNLFDLNLRMANMRGNTFTFGGLTTSWLQGPGLWHWGTANLNYFSRSTTVVKL